MRATAIFAAMLAIALVCPAVRAEEGPPATETKVAEPETKATESGTDKPKPEFDWREFSKKTPPPKQYVDGDLWTRSTLSGDWGGLRNDLAKKGFTLDYSFNQTLQGNLGGGKKFRWPSEGSEDINMLFDTGKMGLYPGGFLKIHAENRFGNSVNGDTGAIMPVNTDSLYPVPDEDRMMLSEVTYVQMLSPQFGVIMGKIQPRESNIFSSNENTQFMNMAFFCDPVVATTVPLDCLAAGVVVMPTDWLTVTALVLDSEGQSNTSGFDTAFERGVTVMNNWTFTIKPFDQVGHQRFTWAWSDRTRVQFEQDLQPDFQRPDLRSRFQNRIQNLDLRGLLPHPEILDQIPPALLPELREHILDLLGNSKVRDRILATLEPVLRQRLLAQLETLKPLLKQLAKDYARIQIANFLEGLPGKIQHQSNDWAASYDFDQYLYTVKDHPDRGFGVFGRFGFGDGQVNPIQNFYSFGVSGKGLASCRPNDSFGVGYYYLGLSGHLPEFVQTRAGDEKGVEMYYNIAVTPWMHITPDLQVIDPGSLGIGTTTVFGIRMMINF